MITYQIISTIVLLLMLAFFLFISIGTMFNKVSITLPFGVYVTKSSISIQSIKNSTKYIMDQNGSYHWLDKEQKKVKGYYSAKKIFINTYYLSTLHIMSEDEVVDLYDAVGYKKSIKGINKFKL